MWIVKFPQGKSAAAAGSVWQAHACTTGLLAKNAVFSCIFEPSCKRYISFWIRFSTA